MYRNLITMKLEDEIQQLKFKSEYQKMSINITFTANWLNTLFTRSMKEFDISIEQFNILRILRGQYPKTATINLLIERMLNKMSNVSRLVEKLRKKGLAERKISTKDRRACDVLITKKGLRLLAELDKAEKKWNKAITNLSQKEARKINELLDKMRG